jgi:hypothetical protein
MIVDGEYLVECIEQREQGKVTVAFALRSRAQPYSIQIDTMDNKLAGLFRALSAEQAALSEKSGPRKVGSQPVRVVEVETVPADVSKSLRRRNRAINRDPGSKAPTPPVSGSRSPTRQLVLMPQEGSRQVAATPTTAKRRRSAGHRHETV